MTLISRLETLMYYTIDWRFHFNNLNMQFCRKLDITGSGISGDNTNFINFEFMGGCFATEWDETEMRISNQPLHMQSSASGCDRRLV